MSGPRHADLVGVLSAVERAQIAKLREVSEKEAQIRRLLLDLSEQQVRNTHLPEDQLSGPRASGADVLWQGWVAQTRHELQIRLARTLASKAQARDAVRLAFGRRRAAEALHDDEMRKGKQKRVKSADSMEQGQALFSTALRGPR